MGEKSKTKLHIVAEAIFCTSTSESSNKFSNGSAIPASNRLVLKFFTDRDNDREHRQADTRTAKLGLDRHVTIRGINFISEICLRHSSVPEETAAIAFNTALN
jgi:hypothetical protein